MGEPRYWYGGSWPGDIENVRCVACGRFLGPDPETERRKILGTLLGPFCEPCVVDHVTGRRVIVHVINDMHRP